MMGYDASRFAAWPGRRAGLALALAAAVLLAAGIAEAGSLEKAQAAAQDGNWSQAAEHFAAALTEKTKRREAALGLAEAAVKAGRKDLYQDAEDALIGLRERNQHDWDVCVSLGEISIALGQAKDDTLAKKSYDAQAIDCFTVAAKARPKDERAVVGLARTHFGAAQFQQAVDDVDAFLALRPDASARALYWKGQALYFLAQDAFRAAGGSYPLPAAVSQLFRQAQGAYRSSAAGDASDFDTWMQLAYASQYLGERDTALDAYRRAAALDPHSPFPFKGIEALQAHDPAVLTQTLKELVTEHPAHPQALFYYAYNRFQAREFAEAAKHLETYVEVAKEPAEGWFWLGKAYAGQGNEKKAVSAFESALKASPDHVYAAAELDQRIVNSGAMGKARSSLAGARSVLTAYEPLLKLAPRNAFIRNNLGFTLREAYVAHQNEKSWVPILEAATRAYVEASEIIGEWTPAKEASLSWAQRYGEAQIISDTGLMFQFYEPTRDLEKAERYYDRALEFTDDGYRDAFNNLSQIMAQQQRWQDLYELAEVCADGIKTEQGQPDEQTRQRARAIMQKLKSDGKVTD